MKIIEQRTYLPSHVVRRAAYDRLVPGGSDTRTAWRLTDG